MMTEQRWRKKIDEYVEEIKKLKEEWARLNEENDQLDADIKIGLQAEDDLQEKIDELEIKLMRSNAVKEELEKQIEDQNKLFRIYNQSCDEAGLVPSREANVKCSQTVIKCYEELSTWHTAQDGEDVILYD